MNDYIAIDLVKTGMKIREMIEDSEFSVKYIQEKLHLACPQSVYRWMSGLTLPSIDNLYMLSKILNVQMEDLLEVVEIKES